MTPALPRPRIRTGPVIAIATVVALALTGLLATSPSPAGAQGFDCDVTITDPSGDTSIGANDILEACATVDGTTMDLAVRTRAAARAGWSASVNADGRQYEVRVETPSADEARALVLDVGTGAIMCEPTPGFGGDDGWRTVRGITTTTCFGGDDVTPLHVRWEIGSDVAPDTGMTLIEEGDGDGDGDPTGDGPLDGGCTTRVVDPANDTSIAGNDILEGCAEYDGFTLDLSIRTRADVRSPFQVELIVDGRAYTAYTEVPNGAAARAVVEDDESGAITCEASPAFGPGDGFRHMRNIDVRACLGGTAEVPITAVWRVGSDRAPDSGTTALVMGEGTDPGGPTPPPPPPPPPAPPGDVDLPPAPPGNRLAGLTRLETSAQIARYAFPEGAPEVYLARADEFADALSGGALTLGPILLVPSCGDLPDLIAEVITEMAPQRVIALGGENAICQDLLDEAQGLAQG